MAFVTDWQKALGYRRDPFGESKRVADIIVDRDQERERLNLFIIKGRRFGILSGPDGNGKSTLLRWLDGHLDRSLLLGREAAAHRKAFVEALLRKALGPLERLRKVELKGEELDAFLLERLAKRRLALLIDDAEALTKENLALLYRIIERCPDVQTIIALERPLKEHEALGKDELGLSLEGMGKEAMAALLERRIGLAGGEGSHPFDERELARLAEQAKGNPAKLLALARDRAIELSLNAAPPPKERAKQRPFSIRFVKEEELQREPKRSRSEGMERSGPSGEAAADAERLGEIVERATSDEEMGAVIEDLSKELGEQHGNRHH